SHFDTAAVGENKKVFMGISLISPGSNDIQEVLDNYEAEIGYYDNGTYYPFGYEVGTNFFELETKYDLLTGTILIFDGNFSILPNKISLDFSKEASYIYGQKGTVNDFDFNVDPIVSTRGTIFTNNWEIYIVNGNAADSATRDPVENRIYIGIMTGIRNNEATSGIVYTDGSGNKYTMYNARLYHGDYYFYYTVYVLHASTSSSYENNINDQPDNRGFFTVKDRTGNDVVEINLSQLELLSISKLKLSIQVNEMINIKDYDGTDELLSFNAELTGGNIYTYDQSYVTCLLDAAYSQSKAGENIPIEPNFKMQFVPGAENSPTAAKALSSYELDATNIFGAEWKETGIINKLNLNVGIVDVPYTANVNGINYPLYKRNYAENTYVILQVAKKGDVLPDGTVAGENYYYYYYSRMNRGVIAESKIGLSTALGISSDKCVKMTINGFLSGEGFEWEHSGSLQDFNQDPIDIRNIFSWVDTSRSPSVAISSTTDSSANETDYYRIEYNNAEILDFMFDNYTVRINLDSPDYAYLNIGKLDLENKFLFVQSNSVYYNYTGQSQINSTVTYQGEGKAVFNFSGHLESQNIINTLNSEGKTFADLVEVRGFYRDCDDTCPHGSYNLNSPEIKNMVIAGTYSLQFNLPSSRNYKGGTLNTSLQIYGKSVKATITFAIRSYLENNPVYNTGFDEVLYVNNAEELALYSYWMSIDPTGTAYDIIAYPKLAQGKINYYLLSDNTNITEIELQNNYNATKVYIDFIALNLSDQVAFDNALEESSSAHGSTKIYYKSNGSYIVADEHISGINEYYMFNEYTMNNTIIYEGFLVKNEFGEDVQEGFTSSDTTHSVIFSIDQYNDKAHTSGLNNGIRAIDAFKHNFDITPANDEFYILKKALTIDVGENTNQTSVYTGNEIVPMYNLVGGNANVGFLGINVHSYTYDGVTQTYEYIKDNVVQPIEQIPFGMRLEIDLLEVGVYTLRLYARPNSEFDMNYATSREPTIITFTIVPLEIVFIGEDITIPYNNTAYELGSFSDYFSGEDSNFGQVSIVDITKSGIEVTEIIDSGIYYVIINGTLLEKYRKNLYFDDGSGNYVYSKEYSYIVTITASNDYQIKLTNNIGGVDLTDQDGFSYTYSGAVYSPSYVFLNLEKETDILPATYTVLNSQGLSEPIKNADTYTLIFEINAVLHEAYNPNYASYEGEDAKVFTIIVNKAPLLVTIGFEEGFAAEKTYLDDNSVIADHMDFIYTGWVDGESCYDPQNIITNPPIIDWDFFNGDTVITIGTETTSGVYAIKPKSGPDTSTLLNYYFSYDGSAIEFEIKKADPYLLVYGIYDEENDEYLDYYVYTGNALEPNVKRKYGDAVIDDSEELIGSEGIKITFAGQFVGTDKHNITESDIAVYDGNCIDVGEYVFLIEVEASSNYNAFEPAYFYLKVVKANLDINVLGEYEGLSRGFATKVYDRTNNYPTFNVTYSGFVGRDAIISSYSNPFPIYSYNLREQTTQITDLGLTHPLYKIYLNAEDMDEDVTPFDAGTYYIKLFIDNSIYGISTNYKINAAYITENDQNLYPVLVIQKRVIDIKAEERIVKTYDGTTKLLQGAVTKSKYSFTAKEGDILTGVVEGDEENINLLVNYVTSCYERKDVNDENDNPTAINIRIYGYDIDNTNYLLDVAQSYLDDEENRYLYLVGTILQAETIVIFRNDENIPVTGTTSVVYDSQTHGLK
ncbi:MAG TPA: hypothetical protein VJ903_02090, partial [Clostridia bacterium]|nr:hypothetical protein [Clostridia bacterium]